jgi:hypothetical protein
MTEVTPTFGQSLLLQALEQLSGLERQIGNLQGQANIIIAEQEHAAEGRRVIYEKLNKLDTLAATVERIAPLVDDHERKHNRQTGAMTLGKTLWAAAAGALGAAITFLFHWLTGGRPPHP